MIFFLTYNIKIHDEHADVEDIGSTAACWINADSIAKADFKVRESIREYNWKILRLVNGQEVNRNDYTEGSTELQYFMEATNKGRLIRINTRPRRKQLP